MYRRNFMGLIALAPILTFLPITAQNGNDGFLLVDATQNKRGAYSTISAAMVDARPGSTIVIEPGEYVEDVTISQDGISLIGGGRPVYSQHTLRGGTVIKGRINCNGKVDTAITDLGVDIRATDHIDAVVSGASTPADYIGQKFERLALVCKGGRGENKGHGILCTSGGGNFVAGCYVYNAFHGVVFRCSNSVLTDCQLTWCVGNSVIIKAASDSGDASRNLVKNCICIGNERDRYMRAGPIRVQSFHDGMFAQHNEIRDIEFSFSGEAAIFFDAVAGDVSFNSALNVRCTGGGDNDERAEFDNNGGNDNALIWCQSVGRRAGFGIRNRHDGDRFAIGGHHIDNSGAGRSNGEIIGL